MSVLTKQLEEKLSPGMYVPEEFKLLFQWIEEKGYYFDSPEYRMGYLAGDDDPGSLNCFCAIGSSFISSEWGEENLKRVCGFGNTGGDGSVVAFWLDDDGHQKIVHFGSGSGSTMASILVDTPLDYLRLLAVGYEELCWPDRFDDVPDYEELEEEYGEGVVLEAEYKQWLQRTFNVSIPSTGSEVVVSTSDMDDDDASDSFCKWIHRIW